MNRIPLVTPDTGDAGAAALLQDAEKTHGYVPNLYATLANAPAMLRGFLRFGMLLREAPTSARPLRELIIMRCAQLSGAAYEWAHHWPLAIESGVPERKLLALSNWAAEDVFTDDERAVLDFAEQVHASGHVTDSTFARLRERFDPEQIVEITLTASFYAQVARFLLAMDVQVEPEFRVYLDTWE
ncbi:carboxymuconolactone decarboxylase family protein [Nonomuraea lactucae]|uniref:carboxymuconolactone decarboxylase family protein n=1 Tax=Nonomuraea lactucae TaxID=2249762 RepID=UPI000DE4FB7C|nr:carboxymuconolactone decarboxylase family protein [Nonomuraea lactucae]